MVLDLSVADVSALCRLHAHFGVVCVYLNAATGSKFAFKLPNLVPQMTILIWARTRGG